MSDRTTFSRHVKDALENMYDPAHLQVHPLTGMLSLKRLSNETGGEALRKVLWEAVELLKPPASLPAHRPEWLSYRLLWLYYLQATDRVVVQSDLGLAERTFYRRLQEAVEAVASVLWENLGHDEKTWREASLGGAASHPTQGAHENALRLIQASHPQVVSLDEVLTSAVETVLPLFRQQGFALVVDVPAALPDTCGGPAVLHQIVVNALLGALEAVGPQGLTLQVTCHDDATFWRIKGMKPTASAEDLLAMSTIALSHELVKGCGWELDIEQDAQAAPELLFTIGCVKPITVLLVDDDADARQLLARLLGTHGYVVQEAHSAQAVPAILAEATPDLILLDVLMPQQDGWKLLQQLKTDEATSSIPVVICSVLGQISLATALGAAAVVQKPVSEETLLETVGRVLAPTGQPIGLADNAVLPS